MATTIPATQARARFTQALIAIYSDFVQPKSFLRSMFITKESLARYISIEVQRMGEPVAVDVIRGTNGNRNSFGKSTEKIIDPPLYHEWFDMTELDLYDVLISTGGMDTIVFARLIEQAAEKLMFLKAKIERAYEKQCAEVLETGVVTLVNGDNIDFKRKAASLVDVNTNPAYSDYWTAGGGDPVGDLTIICEFLRNVGKAEGGTFNAIFGSLALNAMLNNTTFKARADIKDYKLADIQGPVRGATGYSMHGQLSAGAWNINILGYPEIYTDSSGTAVNYVNPRKVIVVPENPKFVMAFGAVPQLLGAGGVVAQQGAYLVNTTRDENATAEKVNLKSAGIAVPVGVDQIGTLQVVAS